MPTEILIALVFRFRYLTPGQAARLNFQSLMRTNAAIARLERSGWIDVVKVLLIMPTPLKAPLAAWAPGQPALPFGSLSHRLMTRRAAPTVEGTILVATRKAANAFGGASPDRSRPYQVGHDASLVEVYLAIRESDPERAETWIGEDCWRQQRSALGFVPDALTVSKDVVTAVEYGGAYGPKRLLKIHSACEAMNLPYELW